MQTGPDVQGGTGVLRAGVGWQAWARPAWLSRWVKEGVLGKFPHALRSFESHRRMWTCVVRWSGCCVPGSSRQKLWLWPGAVVWGKAVATASVVCGCR